MALVPPPDSGLCQSNPVVINLGCTFKSPVECLDIPAQTEPQNNYIRLSGGGTQATALFLKLPS